MLGYLGHKNYPGVLYDYVNGHFYRLRLDSSGEAKIDRKLVPTFDNNISYLCCFSSKAVKRKASVLAWEMLYNSSQPSFVVLHRDLDQTNLKASNLFCLSKEEYIKFKDCLKNTRGAIEMLPHKVDAFSYIVRYRRNNKTKQKTCKDVVIALRLKKKLMLYSLKVLGRYLNTT